MTERPDVTPSDVSGSDVSGSDVSGSDVSGLGYEQARDELAEVVRALEVGGLGLDESVALWERGEALARRCEEQLAGARDRVKAVLEHADDPPAE